MAASWELQACSQTEVFKKFEDLSRQLFLNSRSVPVKFIVLIELQNDTSVDPHHPQSHSEFGLSQRGFLFSHRALMVVSCDLQPCSPAVVSEDYSS